MSRFDDAIRDRVIVADGAMGTMLHAAGVSLDRLLPELNVSTPELVGEVHARYVAAGVDIITSNTFRSSRPRLALAGIEKQTPEINQAGIRLAREATEAADREIFVAGSIGPVLTGRRGSRMAVSAKADALLEQASYLAEAGADLLLFETFTELAELVAAVEACAGLGLPMIGQLTFVEDERTLAGDEPEAVGAALDKSGLTVLGVNCTLGPQGILSVFRRLSACTTIPLSAQPNAGLPRMVGRRRFEYAVHGDYFARHARLYAELGASIVGGCCGTTPEHIHAIRDAVADLRPLRKPRADSVPNLLPTPPPRRATLRDMLESNQFVLGIEIHPPMGADPTSAVKLALDAARTGADLILVAQPPTARAQLSALSLASVLKLQSAIEVAVTLTTWDRSIISLQGDLLGAQAFGIANVICRTGSPPLQGDYPNLDGVWEVDSIGLIELLQSLNEGRDSNGIPIGAPSTFFIGARANPGATDLDAEVRRVQAKVAAGVDYLVTWPLYEGDRLKELCDELGEDRPPILITLQPLRDLGEAEFLRHEVADVNLPEEVERRLQGARDQSSWAGFELALETLAETRQLAQGVVLVRRDEPEALWTRFVTEATKLIALGRPVVRQTGEKALSSAHDA